MRGCVCLRAGVDVCVMGRSTHVIHIINANVYLKTSRLPNIHAHTQRKREID